MTPFEMTGWSMAPWLKPGDLLLADPPGRVGPGDVVVLRNRATDESVVHRVIRLSPLQTKGDRNASYDPLTPDWRIEGVVTRRCRDGVWKPLRYRSVLRLVSLFGLYPGQKLPAWVGHVV
jgi:hypothetical protein